MFNWKWVAGAFVLWMVWNAVQGNPDAQRVTENAIIGVAFVGGLIAVDKIGSALWPGKRRDD